jgi:regulator of replication initiation timing
MNKIKEALEKLLPADQIQEVSSAIEEMLKDAKSELETEFNSKLEEAYAEVSNELKSAENTAEEGYTEAYAIISELRNRLEVQGEEYEASLEEGYEEAYQMLKEERSKNNNLEVSLYEEYDKKLGEMKEYIVDKVDQFLQFKGAEIYEQAKKDVLADPRTVEHRNAFDKIVDITSEYLSDDDYASVSSAKVDEAKKQIDDLKGQIKLLEARSIRLSTENTKLTETVRYAHAAINEQVQAGEKKAKTVNEMKERTEKSKNVMGRGQVVAGEAIIAENNGTQHDFNDLHVLAGIKKIED